jgi:hypothetical protein
VVFVFSFVPFVLKCLLGVRLLAVPTAPCTPPARPR